MSKVLPCLYTRHPALIIRVVCPFIMPGRLVILPHNASRHQLHPFRDFGGTGILHDMAAGKP
jgi:hypothetical protein